LPLQPLITTDFTLVRYISHPDLNFNESYILGWVPHLVEWLSQGKTVYLFIHCPDEARSPTIARYFYDTLKGAYPDLPALPWDSVQKPDAQLSLF
ncbi:MAG: DUF72 domain-containing protein, partial [Cyanobacteria bacterium P01_D01_bin.6]